MIIRRNSNGFTLVELMVVVGIIAILAAFAIPSYQRYVLRSYRVEARNALQEMAGRWQQNYSVSRSWDTLGDGTKVQSGDTLPTAWGLATVPSSGTSRYKIIVESVDSGGYVVKAAAQGAQNKDACGAFFLNQSGTKMATAKADDTMPASGRDSLSLECWSR